MISFYDNQALFDDNSNTSTAIAFNNSQENTSQFNKAECINERENRAVQADVNQIIQRVQENYFLERRSFL